MTTVTRDRDVLVITYDDTAEYRFPIPAISHIGYEPTGGALLPQGPMTEIGNGGPNPWRYYADDAHRIADQINEVVADWLADHYPNLKRTP